MKILFTLICTCISLSLYAQRIDPDDLNGNWKLDKYSDEEQYYHPPKNEEGD